MTVLASAARGDSAAFAALHCPLVSGAETAPLVGGGSPSPAAQTNLYSYPGHKPGLSCPGGLQNAIVPSSKTSLPPQARTSPKRTQGAGRLCEASSVVRTGS